MGGKVKVGKVVRCEVFVSHTKKDEGFCDRFDRACARAGVKSFRSEDEIITPPPWRDIKNAMKRSFAMFLLVGKNLVKQQESHGPEWEYTQNWIAYEIGLACERGIDVWVVCEDVNINFPVPYFNNYDVHDIRTKDQINFMKWVLESYDRGQSFPFPYNNRGVPCPNNKCAIEFNLHSVLHPNADVICPHCLKPMTFSKGWLRD